MRVAFLTTDAREPNKQYARGKPYFGTAPEALLEGFQLMPRQIEVHVVSCFQHPPISSPEKLAENIYYHPLHVPKLGWMRTGYQGCVRAVRRKLNAIKPDLVHGQGTERDCAICTIYAGFPNVLTLHGVMRSIYRAGGSKPLGYYWFAKHLETVALRRTNGVIAISSYVEQIVSPLVRQAWFIPNALRMQFFVPPPVAPRALGPPRLVNVGVVSPNKRQLELLELLMRLRADSEFTVTFVGKTNRHDAYVRKFMDLLLKANVLYGGFEHRDFLSAEGLVELYDASDALVHFSREESFGLIFAEALARNLSVFASDVGAIRQISEGVANCQIFERHNFKRLESALAGWLRTSGHLDPRSQNPRIAIETRYHPKVIAAKHLEVYRSVMRAA